MKAAQVVKAKNVRKGDQLLTPKGWEPVCDADTGYDGEVWLYFDNRNVRFDLEPRARVLVMRDVR